jgi:2',3'-cyclic-nucleotide 2'-phosphodiesterase
MLSILFLGDIQGKTGREAVKSVLPKLTKKHKPDFVIANVENIVHGAGVNREKVEPMVHVGIDVCTTGDHVFDRTGGKELLSDTSFPIIRPANWGNDVPGRGWMIVEKNGKRLLVCNLLGRVFMKIHSDNPFDAIDTILEETSSVHYDGIFLDMHAEATSEKRAIAEYVDGKINAVIGTHTHVQTADPQTLIGGTGFLTDAGMCGAEHSILGLHVKQAMQWIRTGIDRKIEIAKGPSIVCGCIVRMNTKTTSVDLIREYTD